MKRNVRLNALLIAAAVIAVVIAAVCLAKRGAGEVKVAPSATAAKMEAAREIIRKNNSSPDKRQILPAAAALPRTERTWGIEDGDSEADLDELLKLLEAESEENNIRAMLKAQQLSDADRIQFAQNALKMVKDPEFRLDAVGSVDSLSTKRIIPVLALAAADEDPEVRKSAIAALANFDFFREDDLKNEIAHEDERIDDEIHGEDQEKQQKLQDLYEEFLSLEDKNVVADLLLGALADPDADVRQQALDIIERMDADIQYVALEAAMKSEYQELQLEALRLMSANYTRDNFELILEAMNSPHMGVADRAASMVSHLLEKPFISYSEAAEYWKENKHKFGYDMEELQDKPLDVPEESK